MSTYNRLTTTLVAASALVLSGAALASPGDCAHKSDRMAAHGEKGQAMSPGMGQAKGQAMGHKGQDGHKQGSGDRHERMAEMLQLDEEQKEAFSELHESRQAGREGMHERMREMRREMLGASKPEQMRLRAEQMESAAERMSERAEAMEAFYETLDERQQRMIDRMASHGKQKSHGRDRGHDKHGSCHGR
ncbi:MAG: Spy/CpxP family protein refolding chaperone [Guyparkeria sp.]